MASTAAAPLVETVLKNTAFVVAAVVEKGALDLALVWPRAKNVNLEKIPRTLTEARFEFQQLIETLGPKQLSDKIRSLFCNYRGRPPPSPFLQICLSDTMHILNVFTIDGSKLLQHAAELHNAVAVGLYDEAVDACQEWRRQETSRGVVAGVCLVVGMGDSDAVTEFADPGRAARSTVPVQMLGLFQDADVGNFVGYQVANVP
mmetsp:Transcript_11243/g.21203  ORF Transcript_11243/g.21203 Transcript_11243/m.21203 type:complete len:203 (-) Transcript_11243:2140-2748(-)